MVVLISPSVYRIGKDSVDSIRIRVTVREHNSYAATTTQCKGQWGVAMNVSDIDVNIVFLLKE